MSEAVVNPRGLGALSRIEETLAGEAGTCISL